MFQSKLKQEHVEVAILTKHSLDNGVYVGCNGVGLILLQTNYNIITKTHDRVGTTFSAIQMVPGLPVSRKQQRPVTSTKLKAKNAVKNSDERCFIWSGISNWEDLKRNTEHNARPVALLVLLICQKLEQQIS